MKRKPDKTFIQIPSPLSGTNAFLYGRCQIMVAQENGLWHMSISCKDRYPAWDEIRAARYELLPHNITMAMLLPPPDEYVNVHENCFHLWQVRDEREQGNLWIPR